MPAYSGRTAVDGKERPGLHAPVCSGGHTEMIREAAPVQVQSNWKGGRKEAIKVVASVSNVGAGPLIPTGIPSIRKMWLEVSILDGSTVAATQPRPFVLELLDGARKPAMPWDVVRIGKTRASVQRRQV